MWCHCEEYCCLQMCALVDQVRGSLNVEPESGGVTRTRSGGHLLLSLWLRPVADVVSRLQRRRAQNPERELQEVNTIRVYSVGKPICRL